MDTRLNNRLPVGSLRVGNRGMDKCIFRDDALAWDIALVHETPTAGEAEAIARVFSLSPDLLDMLDNVTASLENCLLHHGKKMPAGDLKSRMARVDEAKALIYKARQGNAATIRETSLVGA